MIGLFGGSFDPIHHGHLIVAQRVLEELGLAELRFVPAREQPFKVGRHGAGGAARAEMVRLAIAGEPRFSVDCSELDRPGPSYTVDTLRALRAAEPDREFVLLLGADAAADLDKWHEAAEVPRLARIAVFARGHQPPGAHRAVWRVVPVPAIEISATTIRRRVREGRSIHYWVPDAVRAYIADRRLYLDGDG